MRVMPTTSPTRATRWTFDPTLDASRALTVAAELDTQPARLTKLRATLASINDDLVGENASKKQPKLAGGVPVENTTFRPDQLPDTHFMRFVIVEDDLGPDDNKLPTMLVWECNHDGDHDDYLRRCWRTWHEPARSRVPLHLDFDAIFGACVGYPLRAGEDAWVRWMLAHALRAAAFYSGYRGVAKDRVDAAGRVRRAVRGFLDVNRRELARLAPEELHARLRAHVETLPPPLCPGDLPAAAERGLGFRLRKAFTLLGLGCVVVLAIVPFAPLTLCWYLRLRQLEKSDVAASYDRAVHGNPELIAAEDRIVQNQLTHLVDIKPGRFRAFTQRAVLAVIDRLARVIYVHGQLGGISSIHFARWVILPDTRPREQRRRGRRDRLLFFSNYDFSWDSYLGEFVDRAAVGLTAVWSNTVGFPTTENLLQRGAKDEERFKSWAREHQIASQVWWSGVRWSTVENVNSDVAVHRGVRKSLRGAELTDWLRRL
jgi:hypothetical protein